MDTDRDIHIYSNVYAHLTNGYFVLYRQPDPERDGEQYTITDSNGSTSTSSDGDGYGAPAGYAASDRGRSIERER